MRTSERLEPIYDLPPHKSLEFYRGKVIVATDGGDVVGEGAVHFDWHGGFRIEAEGEGAGGHWPDSPLSIQLSDSRRLDAWPVTSNIRHPIGRWDFRGHCDPQVHGDQQAPLSQVLFHVANCPKSTFGTPNDPPFRVRAASSSWELTLDVVGDYDDRVREVRLSRGGAVTHVGRLRHSDATEFTWKEATTPLEAARFLLSFAAGHRVAPLFAVGSAPQGRGIEEWGTYRRDPFGGVINWCTNFLRGEVIQALWQPTLDRWNDNEEQRLLTVALELYLDAQQGRNIETRLVSAQAGLELLAWHFLTKRAPRLDPERVDKKDAPWRLRRLVKRLNLDAAVPETLEDVTATWPGTDGPTVVCHLRNQITHPKDIASLLELDARAKHGVLRLANWYLELATLRLLDYTGNYLNQTLPLPIFEGRGEPVPWADRSSTIPSDPGHAHKDHPAAESAPEGPA